MLDANRIEKPLRKLRKLLKDFPDHPSPGIVHSLRTDTRRLEAVVAALALESDPQARRLLKVIRPLRKSAGRVRDMDVLIANVLTLGKFDSPASTVQLVQHLASLRAGYSRRLVKAVAARAGEARKRLKRCSRLVQARLGQEPPEITGGHSTGAQILATELRHWPRLEESNLHEFRIRVKELAYLLQFSRDSNPRLLQRLTDLKDAIGDWHDWLELLSRAREVLHPDDDREVLSRIEALERKKLHASLSFARSVMRESIAGSSGRKRGPALIEAVRP